MFASQLTRGTKADFWTLTPISLSNLWYLSLSDALDSNGSQGTSGARPSMYLKSNVVIASDNTGNGTYEYPYTLELGA